MTAALSGICHSVSFVADEERAGAEKNKNIWG